MLRSEINSAILQAINFFKRNGWTLPPSPRWDVTDFSLSNFKTSGLVLVNLAEEPEYCEKLMYARAHQVTPAHTHKKKKEDIICRTGQLCLQFWDGTPDSKPTSHAFTMQVNGRQRTLHHGETLTLQAGERVTIVPGIYHAFWPLSIECIIGEVSTANDDANDNFFIDQNIGRFTPVIEDQTPIIALVSDRV